MEPDELEAQLARIIKELDTLKGMRTGLEELRLQMEELAKQVPTL